MSGIRRDQSTDRAGAPIVGWDKKFGLVKISPLANWTKKDVWKLITDAEHSVQPAARPGLHEHRLLALHAGRDVRRRRAGRPLERHRQDRVRPAHQAIDAARARGRGDLCLETASLTPGPGDRTIVSSL